MSAFSNIIDPDILQEPPCSIQNEQQEHVSSDSEPENEMENNGDVEVAGNAPSSFLTILAIYETPMRGVAMGLWIQMMYMNWLAGMCASILGVIVYAIYRFIQLNREYNISRNSEVSVLLNRMMAFKHNADIEHYKSILVELDRLGELENPNTSTMYYNWIGAVLSEYPALFMDTAAENYVCNLGLLNVYNTYFNNNNEPLSTTVKIQVDQFMKCAVLRYTVCGKRDHRISDWMTRSDMTLEDRLFVGSLDVLFGETDRHNSALLL